MRYQLALNYCRPMANGLAGGSGWVSFMFLATVGSSISSHRITLECGNLTGTARSDCLRNSRLKSGAAPSAGGSPGAVDATTNPSGGVGGGGNVNPDQDARGEIARRATH